MMKKTALSLMLYSTVSFAQLISFNSGETVKARDLNDNFSYIKSLLQNHSSFLPVGTDISFDTYQSGDLISIEAINNNVSKINDLGASFSGVSKISAEDFNNLFSSMKTEIANSYVSPCAGATASLTVNANATVDLAANQVYKYVNITINSGGTLRLNGNTGGWTEICVLGNFV